MRKRKPPQRLLYRTGLTPDEIDRLIAEIGLAKVLAAFDRLTAPDHTFVA